MIKTKPDIYLPVTEEIANSVYLSPQWVWNPKADWGMFFGKVVHFRRQTLDLKGAKLSPKRHFIKLAVSSKV
jgi:hypothetical protein